MRTLLLFLVALAVIGVSWWRSIAALRHEAEREKRWPPAFECPRKTACHYFADGTVVIEADDRRWVLVEVPR